MRFGNHPAIIMKYGAIGATAAFDLWAKIPHVIVALLGLMAIDFIMGVLVAIADRKVQSRKAYVGLMKKSGIILMLGALHLIEEPLHVPFDIDHVAAVAFIVYEMMSILENASDLDLPVPLIIVEFLKNAKIKTATAQQVRDAFSQKTETVEAKTDGTIVTTKQETTAATTVSISPDPNPKL